MEESELMRERLQAITEKHRIQEVIRQKKLDLDQEKLKLKHIKKKSLREQWLLQDSSSHNAPGSNSSEQHTRSLLLNIYRIEKEIEALEREESIVSRNEGFILDRLKAVEKSTQDIIKEAQDSFIPEPVLPVATVTPDFPQSFSPTTNDLPELDEPLRKTLFAMEINVNKNLRTGESTVLSTSSISPEDLHQHSGLKVYDDGRKCVYALHSLEGSDDQSSVSELSANEVEQLLKSATVHRQMTHNNNHYHQNGTKNGYHSYSHEQHPHEPHGLFNGCLSPRNHTNGDLFSQRRHFENHCNGYSHNRKNAREIQRGTSFKIQPNNHHQQVRRHKSFHSNGFNHGLNRANRCPSPRSHDQEVSPHQLCYTPASDIPLSDYINVDDDEPSPAPSPIFAEDMHYTILNSLESSEPITAVFMGFQPARDDMGRGQEFEGALKAEIVIIDDDYGKEEEEKKKQEVSGSVGGAKERRAERRIGPGRDEE